MSSTEIGREPQGVPAVPPARPVPGSRRFRLTWRRVLGLLTLLIVVAVGGYGVNLGWHILDAERNIIGPDVPPAPTEDPSFLPGVDSGTPEPTPGLGTPTRPPRPQATATPLATLPPGRVNILLLGTDKRANDPGTTPRSDTIVLFSVDTVRKTASILNIPRDLLVPIPGYGLRKVNAAYAIGEFNGLPGGGPALAVQTLQKYFGVPIKYYITVNFEGFEKMVDLVGGIYIDVPEALDDDCYPTPWFGCEKLHFDAGYQFMDGATALKYARTRHADSDFGRIRRQQQVILAVRQQALRAEVIPHLPELVDQFGGMVETNISFNNQLAFGQIAAGLDASAITTTQIDSHYVIDRTDPSDGSEAFELNWELAQPLLDQFFGRGLSAQHAPRTSLTPLSASLTPMPSPSPTPRTHRAP